MPGMTVTRVDDDTRRRVNALPIIGTFEGECADPSITNLNGLDITRPVWENVFSSEDYKKGIDLGWYIGFLGHPEDPNCMDFEHACIVMTEGHIGPDGKIYGKFNLIDTPVGRIVKTFIDAGVVFGISVRGAGDIFNNSVDPETFIFRGFDLVTFPAFPESIPVFTEVAASTDPNKRARYQAVCNAVNREIQHITASQTLDILEKQFAPQSKEHKAIDNQKVACASKGVSKESILAAKLEAMTQMYISASNELTSCRKENRKIKQQLESQQSKHKREIAAVKRITASQLSARDDVIDDIEGRYRTAIAANTQLKSDNSALYDTNLNYSMKKKNSDELLREKDSVIASVRAELDETVRELQRSNRQSSNRDEEMQELNARVESAERLADSYQRAYANLYGSALGVDVSNVKITAGMSVKKMQSVIGASVTSSTASEGPQELLLDNGDELVTL